jgi:hypothetical protein
LSAKEKVFGVHTGWNIAFVQNKHPVRNRAFMNFVTNSVCKP